MRRGGKTASAFFGVAGTRVNAAAARSRLFCFPTVYGPSPTSKEVVLTPMKNERHSVKVKLSPQAWQVVRLLASQDRGHDGRPRVGAAVGRLIETAIGNQAA